MDFKKIIADKKMTKLLVPILGVLGMLLTLIVQGGFYGYSFGGLFGTFIGLVFYIAIVSGAFLFDVYRFKIPAIVCAGLVCARGLISGLVQLIDMASYRWGYGFGDWLSAIFHMLAMIAAGVILLLFVLRDRTKKSTIWLIVTGALAALELIIAFFGVVGLLINGYRFGIVFASFLMMIANLLLNAMHPAGYLFEKPETEEEAAAGKAAADRKVEAVKKRISATSGIKAIREESIPLQIVLSIVTCGIYNFVWLFQLTKGVLAVCDEEEKHVGEYLLLILVPFYSIFWYYKRGGDFARSAQSKGFAIEDQSTIYLILALFGFGIVNTALVQDGLNKIARANGNGSAVKAPVKAPVTTVDSVAPVPPTVVPENKVEVAAPAAHSVAEMQVESDGIGAQGVFTQAQEPLEQNDASPEPVVEAVPSADASEQEVGDGYEVLKNLAKLHNMGILTDEEFAAKKAEILSRM